MFDYHEMPTAFLCDNENSNELRKQLIKNQVKIFHKRTNIFAINLKKQMNITLKNLHLNKKMLYFY